MSGVKPHTKIHISVAHHKKTSEVWADPKKRGMLVEVWRLAIERYAPKTNNTVGLRPLDRLSITGDRSLVEADRSLIGLFRSLKYRVRKYPNRWDVHIRNLAKKHGIEAKESDAIVGQDEGPKKEERRDKKQETRSKNEEPDTDLESDALPEGYETGDRIASLLSLTAKSTVAERALWLNAYWVQIVATAQNDQATKGGKLGAHVRSYAISKWQAYLKQRDLSKRAFAREAQAQESASALAASKAAEENELCFDADDPLGDLIPFQKLQTKDAAS